jgi:hypothetical protein
MKILQWFVFSGAELTGDETVVETVCAGMLWAWKILHKDEGGAKLEGWTEAREKRSQEPPRHRMGASAAARLGAKF